MKKNDNCQKVVVIGTDGATFDIINTMIKEKGKLHNLSKIMANGSYGNLQSTEPIVSPAAWTSFMTGKIPEKHNIFDFNEKIPNSYKFRINNATDRTAEPVWVTLSKLNRKVCVVGLTMTYPPDAVNGYMVSGLGTPPSLRCNYIYPPQEQASIEKKIGKFIFGPDVSIISVYRSREKKEMYLKQVRRTIQYRIKLFKYLYEKQDTDFGMIFFMDIDGASHYFWRFMDKLHSGYDAANHCSDVIYKVYEMVDEAIEELQSFIPAGTNIFLVSDHGFGPINRVLFLNNWLGFKGYLTRKENFNKQFRYRRHLLRKIYPLLNVLAAKVITSRRLRDILQNKFKFLKTVDRNQIIDTIDWGKTKAFFNGTIGKIYVNLKGRETEGIVGSEEEYNNLCEKLCGEIPGIKDPLSGKMVVEKVIWRKGKIPSKGPDIILVMKKGFGIAGIEILAHGIKDTGDIFADSKNWSGDHELNGILICQGPSIKNNNNVYGARLIDIAPTILYLMNCPIPQDMDGKVLKEVITEEFINANRIEYTDSEKDVSREKLDYSNTEEDEVAKALKSLGYFD